MSMASIALHLNPKYVYYRYIACEFKYVLYVFNGCLMQYKKSQSELDTLRLRKLSIEKVLAFVPTPSNLTEKHLHMLRDDLKKTSALIEILTSAIVCVTDIMNDCLCMIPYYQALRTAAGRRNIIK